MIKDAYNGKIDLILTKSVSRFARNTVDSLNYIRELKYRNIGVYFEEEGIYTLNNSSELILTILSSVAQKETENTSAHILLGKEMSLLQGKIVNTRPPFGYDFDKSKRKFVINKQQAKIVKKIFEVFLENENIRETTRYLINKKYKNYNENLKWDRSSVRKILSSKRYIGIFETSRKLSTTGEKLVVENYNPKIINEEIFDKVQKILDKNRSPSGKRIKNNRGMYCGFCGFSLAISNPNKTSSGLLCSMVNRNLIFECNDAKLISIKDLRNIFIECLMKYLNESGSIKNNNFDQSINNYLSDKEINIRKKCTNVELLLKGKINRNTFNLNNSSIDLQISEIEKKLNHINNKKNEAKGIQRIKKEFYDYVIDNFDSKLSFFDMLYKMNLILIVGGYDENNHKKPYMIRFIYFNNHRELSNKGKKDFYKNLTINNYENFSYLVLLDYKSKYVKRVFAKTLSNGKNVNERMMNKSIRVRLEIVEEK